MYSIIQSFIAQGTIIQDLRTADMVLIGGKRNETYDHLCELYNRIQETPPKISIMSTTAAELVKLSVNCFLPLRSVMQTWLVKSWHCRVWKKRYP